MSSKKKIDRIVQYWRLTNSSIRDFPDYNPKWNDFYQDLASSPTTIDVNGFSLTGTHHSISLTKDTHEQLISLNLAEKSNNRINTIVLAKPRDSVPRQQHNETFLQEPMKLNGDDWSPVDNLFVWVLPFGRMIATLSESVSSAKEAALSDWITKAMFEHNHIHADSNFSFNIEPVIDKNRKNVLSKATGLKDVQLAFDFGDKSMPSSRMAQIRNGLVPKNLKAEGLVIEVTIKTKKGFSSSDDEQVLLDYYSNTFGSAGLVSNDLTRHKVTALHGVNDRTEVDLIKQILTRKTKVPLSLENSTQVFHTSTAVESIIKAFILDHDDLRKLSVE